MAVVRRRIDRDSYNDRFAENSQSDPELDKPLPNWCGTIKAQYGIGNVKNMHR